MKKYLFDLPTRDLARKEAADAVGTNPGENLHNSLISEPARMGGTAADGKEAVL